MFKASPKSCGFQTLQLGRLFILWDPIILWIALYTYFLLSTMAFCPTINLGSSMSNGYWRTFCLMRWSSSYSTAGHSKNHFWSLLKIARNPPIDLGFSKVSCSLVPFKCSTVQNESLYQVSPQGSLDVFSLFIASDSDILSFDGRFESRKFDEQWVFEDLVLHEKGLFLLHCWT